MKTETYQTTGSRCQASTWCVHVRSRGDTRRRLTWGLTSARRPAGPPARWAVARQTRDIGWDSDNLRGYVFVDAIDAELVVIAFKGTTLDFFGGSDTGAKDREIVRRHCIAARGTEIVRRPWPHGTRAALVARASSNSDTH